MISYNHTNNYLLRKQLRTDYWKQMNKQKWSKIERINYYYKNKYNICYKIFYNNILCSFTIGFIIGFYYALLKK